MNIEQIGDTTLYEFNWVEHLLVNAAIKHVDRKRRAGESDSLLLHSALRAVFFDRAPTDESCEPVRWILDEDEYTGHGPDEACRAPKPEVLAAVMQHVSHEIACGNTTACTRAIGQLTLAQPLGTCTSQQTYREETLAQIAPQIKSFGQIISSYE